MVTLAVNNYGGEYSPQGVMLSIFHSVKLIAIRPAFVQPEFNFFHQQSEQLAPLDKMRDY